MREAIMTRTATLLLLIACCLARGSLVGQGLDPALLTKPATDAWPTYEGEVPNVGRVGTARSRKSTRPTFGTSPSRGSAASRLEPAVAKGDSLRHRRLRRSPGVWRKIR